MGGFVLVRGGFGLLGLGGVGMGFESGCGYLLGLGCNRKITTPTGFVVSNLYERFPTICEKGVFGRLTSGLSGGFFWW